jgi:hypothetical protein
MSGGATFIGTNVTQAGVPLLVFTFSSFTLDSALSITFSNAPGDVAIAFLSQSDMAVSGVIDASGYAGGGAGEGGSVNYPNLLGGGGGGFGGAGGDGQGNYFGSEPGGSGGGSYNPDLTVQLASGSQGGPGEPGSGLGGAGGPGGGALQLAARETLTVAGSVHVDGASGAQASFIFGQDASGGGGSGGGLLLQGGNVNIEKGAILSANGGEGDPSFYLNSLGFPGPWTDLGGGGGGGGRIVIAYSSSGITNGSISAAAGTSEFSYYGANTNTPCDGTVVIEQNSAVPAYPSIATSLDSSGHFVMSWPSSATNYVLQSSPVLGENAVWNTITGATPSGANFILTNTIVGIAEFFRLAVH